METKLLHSENRQRALIAVLETGDEVMECLRELAVRERLSGAQITAIGAFSDPTLPSSIGRRRTTSRSPVGEQVEVASLIGDIATDEDGAPAVHLHVVLGKQDGAAVAGPSRPRACARGSNF